jgi:hypothetical protein
MLSEKERLWLKRKQNWLMFGRGKCPGGRLLRKRRLWNKHVKYLRRYEAAFMDGEDEVSD